MNLCRFLTSLRNVRLSLRPAASGSIKGQYCNKFLISTTTLMLTTEGEARLTKILQEKLNPTFVEVKDISGGCGAMYKITIDSEMFRGKRTIQQHKMINEALGDEIKELHGLTIQIGNPTLNE